MSMLLLSGLAALTGCGGDEGESSNDGGRNGMTYDGSTVSLDRVNYEVVSEGSSRYLHTITLSNSSTGEFFSFSMPFSSAERVPKGTYVVDSYGDGDGIVAATDIFGYDELADGSAIEIGAISTTGIKITVSYSTAQTVGGKQLKLSYEGPYSFESDDDPDPDKTIDISTAADLVKLSADCKKNNGYADYIINLTRDIDLGGVDWTPIGTGEDFNNFYGVFRGNNHTISGLSVENPEGSSAAAGLFGYCVNATIENLTVNGSVKGNYVTGGICGSAFWSTITNCVNYVTVTGIDAVGGICGGISDNRSVISGCTNNGIITGNNDIGGIVGKSGGDFAIKNCVNNGVIAGNGWTGGICGYAAGLVKDCVNNADISGTYATGGICGASSSSAYTFEFERLTVSGCTNNGDITGEIDVGGISGQHQSYLITNCTNTGTVTGSKQVIGGIAGYLDYGRIYNSVNSGAVYGCLIVGGIAGELNRHCVINGCTNRGYVVAQDTEALYAGGIVGESDRSMIVGCISEGNVYATTAHNIFYGRVGGIAGDVWDTFISACYTGGISVTAPVPQVKVGLICGLFQVSSSGVIETCYTAGSGPATGGALSGDVRQFSPTAWPQTADKGWGAAPSGWDQTYWGDWVCPWTDMGSYSTYRPKL